MGRLAGGAAVGVAEAAQVSGAWRVMLVVCVSLTRIGNMRRAAASVADRRTPTQHHEDGSG